MELVTDVCRQPDVPDVRPGRSRDSGRMKSILGCSFPTESNVSQTKKKRSSLESDLRLQELTGEKLKHLSSPHLDPIRWLPPLVFPLTSSHVGPSVVFQVTSSL